MHQSDECQRLNERASRLYESGDYDGAKRLWEEVLKISPSDPRASEGHRMASILVEGWSPLPLGGSASRPPADSPRAAIPEIESMLEDGRITDAMEHARWLLDQAPDDVAIQEIHAAALRAYEA